MLVNVKIISKQLISPNLGKHIHSRNFLATPNPNSLMFFRSHHQVGLVCSQGENHCSNHPLTLLQGEVRNPGVKGMNLRPWVWNSSVLTLNPMSAATEVLVKGRKNKETGKQACGEELGGCLYLQNRGRKHSKRDRSRLRGRNQPPGR